jgi:hypothetical protein
MQFIGRLVARTTVPVDLRTDALGVGYFER